MDFLLSRYRNLTVLLIVIAAQLILIAYQVKTNRDVPLLRVWAVSTVTPIERGLEFVRRNTWGFVEDYFILLGARRENERLRKEIGQVKLQNQFLKTELSTADRARALAVFQERSQSKTMAARIVGNGTGANSNVVFVDRGSGSGVESGMAVITPDGIVGKVVAAYPTASLVMLITNANFAAGVISQTNRVHGTLKGQGHEGTILVDYIQNEAKVDPGEWFYTSGDDRVFPKGFPVGQATTVRNGRGPTKEIFVTPSGFQNGLEEVLIVIEGVHQEIPDTDAPAPGYKLLPPPPEGAAPAQAAGTPAAPNTDADRLRDQYKQLGETQKHTYGVGGFDKPPDFTKLSGNKPAVAAKPQPESAAPSAQTPANPSAPLATPTPLQAKPAADVAAKPKPRPSGPILVTDPADADPTSEPAETRPSRVEKKLKPITVDANTEILPPAPAPKRKPASATAPRPQPEP